MSNSTLDRKTAIELGGALARREEIRSNKIQTKDTEAELRGLDAYISTALDANARELLGCWFTVRNEYEPLLQSVTTIANRVRNIFAASDAAATPKTAEVA